MLSRINKEGIRIINSVAYGLLIVFITGTIATLIMNLFFQFEHMHGQLEWSLLTLLFTFFSEGVKILIIYWVYKVTSKYLYDPINKKTVLFVIGVYWIIVYTIATIGYIIQLFTSLYAYFMQFAHDIQYMTTIHQTLFKVYLPLQSLVFIYLGWRFIRDSGYLLEKADSNIS